MESKCPKQVLDDHEAREARKRYFQEYRAARVDELNQYQREYRAKNLEKIRAADRDRKEAAVEYIVCECGRRIQTRCIKIHNISKIHMSLSRSLGS